MTLVPLPRAAVVLVGSLAILALLLRLFSYEFSVPSEGVSGVTIAALPRADVVVLSEVPSDAGWLSVGDEWGGPWAFLRTVLIRVGFILGGAVMVLHALAGRAPRLAHGLFLAAVTGCLSCCALGGLTRGWVNYETQTFFLSPACCTPHALEIIGPRTVEPHVRLVVNARTIELLSSLQSAFGYALSLGVLLLCWGLYSKRKEGPRLL
jgi:hypothetical protein